MKKITIDGKEFEISCSAYSKFLYKKMFGSGMIQDINKLNKLTEETIDDGIDVLFQVTYILILMANPKFMSFEDFLKSISAINLSDPWVSEVTELAVDSFLG